MKVSRRVRYTVDVDGQDVDLAFDPINEDDILAERIGDKLVIAYLVQDQDPCNPMKEFDGQGNLYTHNERVITDDQGEVYRALGLDIYGDIDIDKEFEAAEPWLDHNKILQLNTTLRDLAADQFVETVKGDLDLQQRFLEYMEVELVEGEDYKIDLAELRRDLVDCNGCFWEEVEGLARELFPTHWRKLADPYVVPVRYDDYGSRGCQIYTTTWDGDIDDMPNAAWVADKAARDNLKAPGEEGFEERLTDYAKAVLNEYESWCNGDVYGCVVETFRFQWAGEGPIEDAIENGDGEWEQTEMDSCWGFIGSDHAKESLKTDFFEPAIAQQKDRTTFRVQLPPGALQLSKD